MSNAQVTLLEGNVALLSHEMFIRQLCAAAEAGDMVDSTTKEALYKMARSTWARCLHPGYHFCSPDYGMRVMLIPHSMWCELLRHAV